MWHDSTIACKCGGERGCQISYVNKRAETSPCMQSPRRSFKHRQEPSDPQGSFPHCEVASHQHVGLVLTHRGAKALREQAQPDTYPDGHAEAGEQANDKARARPLHSSTVSNS